MPNPVHDAKSRAVDRALLIAAVISFGCGLMAMVSGLVR